MFFSTIEKVLLARTWRMLWRWHKTIDLISWFWKKKVFKWSWKKRFQDLDIGVTILCSPHCTFGKECYTQTTFRSLHLISLPPFCHQTLEKGYRKFPPYCHYPLCLYHQNVMQCDNRGKLQHVNVSNFATHFTNFLHIRVIQKECLEEEIKGKFLKTEITTSQGAKWSFVIFLK
jgi:hypothetical protein